MMGKPIRSIAGSLAILFVLGTACGVLAEQRDPGLTVFGRGEVSADSR